MLGFPVGLSHVVRYAEHVPEQAEAKHASAGDPVVDDATGAEKESGEKGYVCVCVREGRVKRGGFSFFDSTVKGGAPLLVFLVFVFFFLKGRSRECVWGTGAATYTHHTMPWVWRPK